MDSGASIIIVPNVTTFRFRDIVIVNGSGLTGATVSVGGIVCNANQYILNGICKCFSEFV